MTHQVILQLVIAYALVGAFLFTVVITCLSLVGWVRFADSKQQHKLFYALIVELVVACMAFFAGFVKFDPSQVLIAARREIVPPVDPSEQAKLYLAEDSRLKDLAPSLLAQSLNPTAGGYVWGQFYRYRATIRAQLRRLCAGNAVAIRPDESITSMVEQLEAKGRLGAGLAKNILRISRATYTAQWGSGDSPTPDDARFVATEAPRIIEQLATLDRG